MDKMDGMDSNDDLVILVPGPALRPRAQALADSLHLPLVVDACGYSLVLRFAGPDARLELLAPGPAAAGAVAVDFRAGRHGWRRRHGRDAGGPLARAVGLKQGQPLEVLDLTAGLGRDGFVLAGLGARVTLVERHPVVAALLADGLRRAAADADLAPTVAGIRLTTAQGLAYLAGLDPEHSPEVIYLDPMYPHRRKSALVKKESRVLRALVGNDPDAPALLEAALGRARRRVVVKRPKGAPPLGDRPPQGSIPGSTTRYDIYRPLTSRSTADSGSSID